MAKVEETHPHTVSPHALQSLYTPTISFPARFIQLRTLRRSLVYDGSNALPPRSFRVADPTSDYVGIGLHNGMDRPVGLGLSSKQSRHPLRFDAKRCRHCASSLQPCFGVGARQMWHSRL